MFIHKIFAHLLKVTGLQAHKANKITAYSNIAYNSARSLADLDLVYWGAIKNYINSNGLEYLGEFDSDNELPEPEPNQAAVVGNRLYISNDEADDWIRIGGDEIKIVTSMDDYDNLDDDHFPTAKAVKRMKGEGPGSIEIGESAKSTDLRGISIGFQAKSKNGVAIGDQVEATTGVSVGRQSETGGGVSIGSEATSGSGTAIGSNAEANGGIAIGTGTKAILSSDISLGKWNENVAGVIIQVGNGTSENNRSNIFRLDNSGRIRYKKDNNNPIRPLSYQDRFEVSEYNDDDIITKYLLLKKGLTRGEGSLPTEEAYAGALSDLENGYAYFSSNATDKPGGVTNGSVITMTSSTGISRTQFLISISDGKTYSRVSSTGKENYSSWKEL